MPPVRQIREKVNRLIRPGQGIGWALVFVGACLTVMICVVLLVAGGIAGWRPVVLAPIQAVMGLAGFTALYALIRAL